MAFLGLSLLAWAFIGGAALGLASFWLMPDMETGSKGVDIERQGSDQPIPVVYGTRKVGAVKVHKYVTDTPNEAWNDLLHLIVVFSEGEVDGLEELFFNGVKSTDPKFSGGRLGGKWFSIDFYNGADGQPASAAAVSGIPNWTIDHRLDGLCYAYIVLQMPDPEAQIRVWSGEPDIQAVIRGKKILDTRTGLTEYSENPAMCLRDYLTNPIYGKGLPDSFIDDDSFEYVAARCDDGVENTVTTTTYNVDRTTVGFPDYVPTTATTTETLPRFACNLLIDTNRDYIDNISELLSSFRGIVQDMTGSAKITYESTIDDQYNGATNGEPVFTFTGDDIVGDIDHDGGSIDDRHNVFEVRFPNRIKNYETDSVFFPEESDPLRAQWLEEDGGKRQDGSMEIDSITTKAEALQLAEILAKRSRFNRVASFTGMPWTIQVEVGDIVGLDSLMNGWTDKPFRVMEKKLNEDDTVDFTLREHEDTVYPWSGRAFDDIDGGTWLGDPDDVPPVTGLSLTQDPTLSRTGTLTWQSVANAWVRRYEVKIIGASGTVFDVDVLGNAWDVPLLDTGDYTAEVYAVSQTGARSPSTALSFTLAEPVAPTSLSITPRDWELEVAPQLAGIGLGTVFEFDIVTGDGTGYTPTSKGRASTFTFTGLLPDTLYTVYARSVNAYGVSGWTSAQATTTNTGAQVEPFTETIRQELDQIETEFSTFDPSNDWRNTVQNLLSGVGQDVTEIFERREDVDTEKEQRIQQFNEISVELSSKATITELDEVYTDIEGNAIAISGVQAQVNDPANNTSALYSFVQTAQTTADGNAESITELESRVDSNEDFASAQLELNAGYNSELDTLTARAFLGTDVNNRVTGIIVNDDGTNRQIEFQSDSVVFLDGNSQQMIYFDNTEGRYVFDGNVEAQSFTGQVINGANIVGGAITADKLSADAIDGKTITGAVVQTSSGTGSRTVLADDGTYHIWAGSGTKTDANGTFWIKKDGTGFISGQFFQGEILENAYGENSGQLSVTAANHGSKGNPVDVVGSIGYGIGYTQASAPDDTGPTLSWEIRRDTTVIKSGSSQVIRTYEFDGEINEYRVFDRLSLSPRTIDTSNSQGTYDYTLTVSGSNGVVYSSGVGLVLSTSENLIG